MGVALSVIKSITGAAIPGLNLLDNKWTWIILGTLLILGGGLFGLHMYVHEAEVVQAQKDQKAMQAAEMQQQIAQTNSIRRLYVKSQKDWKAKQKASEEVAKKEAAAAASLRLLLRKYRSTGHGLSSINDRLRSKLEDYQGSKYSSAERKAVATDTSPIIMGLTASDVKAILHNEEVRANYQEQVRATQKEK